MHFANSVPGDTETRPHCVALIHTVRIHTSALTNKMDTYMSNNKPSCLCSCVCGCGWGVTLYPLAAGGDGEMLSITRAENMRAEGF